MDIDKIQKSVMGSLAVENAKPSKEGIKTTRDFLEGKLSSIHAVAQIKSYWLKKYIKVEKKLYLKNKK